MLPCRQENAVAIDLITQHIRVKLQQPDLRRIFHNLEVIPSNYQIRGMHTIIRDVNTNKMDFVFYADRLLRLVSIMISEGGIVQCYTCLFSAYLKQASCKMLGPAFRAFYVVHAHHSKACHTNMLHHLYDRVVVCLYSAHGDSIALWLCNVGLPSYAGLIACCP